MKTTVIIPARWASSRFPGKPLHPLHGVPMLQRVWAIAKSAPGINDVLVATDHDAIEHFCRTIGAACVRTPPECRNGTERVAATLDLLPSIPDVVINLQGDAVLTPPWVIQAMVQAFVTDQAVKMATPATRMTEAAYQDFLAAKKAGEVGGTTVVFDTQGDALYFSKMPIPYVRRPPAHMYRHIGLYAYTPTALRALITFEPGPLEKQEELEQLRALENGLKIRVVTVDYCGRTHTGVDSPADAQQAETLIHREGELLPRYDGTYQWSETT